MALKKEKEFPQPPSKVRNWGNRKINLIADLACNHDGKVGVQWQEYVNLTLNCIIYPQFLL